MRMTFFFDQSRCMGCNTCSVACKDYYNVNPGPVKYRHQVTHTVDDNKGTFYPLSMACNHCEDPACLKACGANAISKRSDGIVVVNRNKCMNLKTCVTACPFTAAGIADDKQETVIGNKWLVKHPMQKCNMCVELLDKGESPVCVRACPLRAIEVGDYDELMIKYPDAEVINIDKHPYAYQNSTQTGPSFLIRPRKKLIIEGPYK